MASEFERPHPQANAAPATRGEAVDIGVAGVGGIGAGTILVAVADLVPALAPWSDLVALLAPSVSVILTAGWYKVSSSLRYRWRIQNAEKAIEIAIAETESDLKLSGLTDENKTSLKKSLAGFRQKKIDLRDKKISKATEGLS